MANTKDLWAKRRNANKKKNEDRLVNLWNDRRNGVQNDARKTTQDWRDRSEQGDPGFNYTEVMDRAEELKREPFKPQPVTKGPVPELSVKDMTKDRQDFHKKIGTDTKRFGTEKIGTRGPVRTDLTQEAWEKYILDAQDRKNARQQAEYEEMMRELQSLSGSQEDYAQDRNADGSYEHFSGEDTRKKRDALRIAMKYGLLDNDPNMANWSDDKLDREIEKARARIQDQGIVNRQMTPEELSAKEQEAARQQGVFTRSYAGVNPIEVYDDDFELLGTIGSGRPEGYGEEDTVDVYWDAALYDGIYGQGSYADVMSNGTEDEKDAALDEIERLWTILENNKTGEDAYKALTGESYDDIRAAATEAAGFNYETEDERLLKEMEAEQLGRGNTSKLMTGSLKYSDDKYHEDLNTTQIGYNGEGEKYLAPKDGGFLGTGIGGHMPTEAEKIYYMANHRDWQTWGNKESAANAQDNTFFMTDEEVAVFNRYFNAGDTASAMAFYDGLKNSLESARREWLNYLNTEMTQEHPWLMTAGSVLQAPVSGFVGTAATVAAMFGNKDAGNLNSRIWDLPSQQQTVRSTGAQYAGEKTQEILADWGVADPNSNVGKKLGQFLYGVGTSMGDMGVSMLTSWMLGGGAVVQPLVQAIMSGEATSSAMVENLKKGMGPLEAGIRAIGSGAIEAVTEKYSIEALLQHPKRYVGYVLQNMFTEGSEEVASTLLNTIQDEILSRIYGHESEIQSEYNDILAQIKKENPNISKEDAARQASRQVLGNYLENLGADFAGGAMSGGMMAGVAATGYAASDRAQTRTTAENLQKRGNVGTLLDAAGKYDGGKNYNNTIKALTEKYQKDQQLSLKDTRRLVTAMRKSGNDIVSNAGKTAMTDAVEEQIQAKTPEGKVYSKNTVRLAAEAVAELATSEKPKLTREQEEAYKAVPEANQVMRDVVITKDEGAVNAIKEAGVKASTAAAQDLFGEINRANRIENREDKVISASVEGASSRMASEEQIQAVIPRAAGGKTTGNSARGVAIYEAEEGTRYGTIVGKEGRQIIVENENGERSKVDITDVKTGDAVTAAVVNYIDITEMDDTTAGEILQAAQDEAITKDNVKGFLQDATGMIIRGHLNAALPNRMNFSTGVAQKLYNNARKAAATYESNRAERARQSGYRLNPGKGQVTYADSLDLDSLDSVQREWVDAMAHIAEQIGFNITFENDTKNRNRFGGFDLTTNSVILNLAGEDKTGIHHIMVAASHELTHLLENNSPEQYKALRDFVFDQIRKQGGDDLLVEMVRQKMENYNYQINKMRQNGQTVNDITIDGAIAEVVADACDQVLGNEKLINQLANDNPSLFQKMKNFVADFIRKVKAAVQGMRRSGSRESLYMKDMDELARLWGIALEEVQDKNTTIKTGETETTEPSAASNAQFSLEDGNNEGGFKEDKYFNRRILNFTKENGGNGYITVGSILEGGALNQVGIPAGKALYDNSKILKNLTDHGDSIDENVLALAPRILAKPIAITEADVPNTVTAWGDVVINGQPLMVAVMVAKNRAGILMQPKVRTINVRRDYAKLINDETVLYITENKKEARTWFNARGINVPLGESAFGFIRSIQLQEENSNGQSGQNENALQKDLEAFDGTETHYGDHRQMSLRVRDEDEIRMLEGQDHITTYKTMQLIDGHLYPPMAAVVAGSTEDYSILGKWEKATEHPELIKNGGKFTLNKGKGKGSLDAAYNPYMHSSNLVINDQFTGAYNRPELVTVECEVPVSEKTSGYHAEFAKDSVGWHSWHTGTVAGKVRAQKGIERQVFLSRWIKPVRIMSNEEVAQKYKELLDGTDIAVPDNVVSPGLLEALKKEGVKIEESGRLSRTQMSLAEAREETGYQDENMARAAGAQDTNGQRLFSLASMEHDRELYYQMLADNGILSQKEIDGLFDTIDLAMETIRGNRMILDLNERGGKEDRAFSPVKPNSDPLYRVSLDFSTLCRKRLLQQALQEMIEKKYKTVMTKAERVAMRNALQELQKEGKRIEIACALCYVESARLKSPAQIQRFMSDKRGQIVDYLSKNTKEYKQQIDEAEAAMKVALGYEANTSLKTIKKDSLSNERAIRAMKKRMYKEYTPSAAEEALIRAAETMDESMFKTAAGLAELKRNYPLLFDAYTTSIRNATKSKGIESDVPFYAGDTRDTISDDLIRKMNAENGLRSQSWSDFQVYHILDYIGAIMELSTRGAKMQAYTKVPDYVRLMGKTGQMINLSLIPTDYNGTLGYDPNEGMPFEIAQEMRDLFPDTAGNICIGISDDHIRALLASDDIDYVIPYHKSSMDKETRQRIGLKNWDEYESQQNEKNHDYPEADEKSPDFHRKPEFSEWFNYREAVALAEGFRKSGISMREASKMAMQEMANRYIDLCHQRGLQEKFANFSSEDGYWKLLIDRKMINQISGKIIEQQAVRPVFDSDTIQQILKDEVARVKETQPDIDAATDEIMKKWENGEIRKAAKTKAVQDTVRAFDDRLLLTNIIDSAKFTEQEEAPKLAKAMSLADADIDAAGNEYDPTIYNGKLYVKPETLDYWLSGHGFAATNPKYAQAYITTMDPADFLRMTTVTERMQQRLLNEATPLDEDRLSENAQQQPIQLIIDEASGKVVGHEGRHRAIALSRAGVREMPVLLFDSSTKYTKEAKGVMILDGQSYGDDANVNTLVFRDVIPLNGENADLIRERFTASDADKQAAAQNEQRTLEYSLADSTPSANDWMMWVDVEDLRDAEEKRIVNSYRMRVADADQTRQQIRKIQRELKNATGDEARRLRINLQTEQNKLQRQEDAINTITGSEKWGQMLQDTQRAIDTYLTGQTQEQVNRSIQLLQQQAKSAEKTSAARARELQRTIQFLQSRSTQRLMEEQKKWRDRIQNDRNARQLAERNMSTRRQINTAFNRLAQRLINETDERNVPEQFKAVVRAALRPVLENDAGGHRHKITGADLTTLKEQLRVLRAMDQRDGTQINLGALTEDEGIQDAITEALEDIQAGIAFYNSDGRVRDENGRVISSPGRMAILQGNQAALERIRRGISQIWDIVHRSGQAFIDGKYVEVSNVAYEVETDAKKRGVYREFVGTAGKAASSADRGIRLGNFTPWYFFKRLKNNGLSMLYNEMGNGENRYGLLMNEMQKRVTEIAEKAHYGTWDLQKKTSFKLKSGKTVSMTVEQIMSLMATWKRENTLGPEMSQHLLKGGFVYEEEADKMLLGRQAQERTPYRVTAEDVEQIIGSLTDEQKAYVDDMVGLLSTRMSELGNEASMRMYGIKKYNETYYFPFQVWDGVKNKTSNAGSQVNPTNNNRAAHQGWTKRRTANASNALMLEDFTKACAQHMTQMITYSTMGTTIENMNRVLNFRITEREQENNYDPNLMKVRNIESLLTERYGKNAVDYIRTFMQDINGGAVQDRRNSIQEKLLSLFRKNAVAGSLSVSLQQPLSYIRAAMMINPKYLVSALNPTYWKGSYQEMMEHSGVAVIKSMGRFDMNYGMTGTEYLTPDAKKTKGRAAYDWISEKSTILPEKMDQMTWTRMWSACKLEQHSLHPEMDVTSDAFLDMVGKRFNEVMRGTQVYDSVLVKSSNMRSNKYTMKVMTSFMAEPTLTANMLYDAFADAKEKGGARKAAEAAGVYVLSAVLQAAVKGIMGSGRSPDEKKTLAENFLIKFFTNFMNEANPLNLIAGYSTIVEAMSGSSVSDNALGVIKTITADVPEKAIKALTGEGRGAYRDLEDTAGQVAQLFTGVPARNIMRDMRAMYNWVLGNYADRDTSGTVIKYAMVDALASEDLIGAINDRLKTAGLGYDTGNAAYYERIYEAERRGDTQKAEELKEYMTAGKGAEQKTITSKVKSIANDDESLTGTEKVEFLYGGGYTDRINELNASYKAGEITQAEYKAAYRKYFPDEKKTDAELFWKLDELDYQAKNGSSDGYSKYARFDQAVADKSLSGIRTATKELIRYSTVKDIKATMKSSCGGYIKPLYIAAATGSRDEVTYLNLANAVLEEAGYTKAEREKYLESWKKDKQKK